MTMPGKAMWRNMRRSGREGWAWFNDAKVHELSRRLKRRSGKAFPILNLFLAMLLITTACSLLRRGESNVTLGTESSLAGQATLLCSRECSERGQCGTSDQGEMVLLNSTGPATGNHDMAIAVNTVVNIDHEEARTVVQVSNDEPMRLSFYAVQVPERGPGWVAGWCIGQ